jgi:ZIP family zinc transporter
MSNILGPITIIGISGFLTGLAGIFTGITFSLFTKRRGRRFRGTVLGFIGGLMLAIVTLDLLPESFEQGSIYITTIGTILGLILAVGLDGKLDHGNITISDNYSDRYIKAAIFMAIGIGIHNIPSGIALGSLSSTSPLKAFHLAIALIIHGIPEGLAIGIFLKESSAKLYTLIFISILTSLPMGLGSLLGGIMGNISPVIISISLSFAGGMILYIICRETLPSAIDTWRGRMSTIGNISGFIAGMLFVSFLH